MPIDGASGIRSMSSTAPTYTHDNFLLACQLHWLVSIYWRYEIFDSTWADHLKSAVEPKKVQIHSHRFSNPGISQFRVSSNPHRSPLSVVTAIRRGLHDEVQQRISRPLLPEFHIRSVGKIARRVWEGYVATELDHDNRASDDDRRDLRPFQICRTQVDLSIPQHFDKATFSYNLHLVMEFDVSDAGISEATARHMRDAILEVSRDHDYQLSRGAILPDHIDLIVGCPLDETPTDVALQYLNRLSDHSGRQQIFRFSASVSTFDEDDLDGME